MDKMTEILLKVTQYEGGNDNKSSKIKMMDF